MAMVSGRVVIVRNDSDLPVPGLSVSLLSEKYGRSVEKVTDNTGGFSIQEVPLNGNPFFLEVRSSKELLYRRRITILKDTVHDVHL